MHTRTIDTTTLASSAIGLSPGRQEMVTLGRRSFLQSAIVGMTGVVTGTQIWSTATSASPPVKAESNQAIVSSTPTGNRVLLAYFSRTGENYYYGDRIDLEVGNTEVLTGMIADRVACDVYRIESVEPYSDNYDATVERNVQEQEADARPTIANLLTSIEPYDVVLLGSPIWNVRAPMIMSTFAESFDFTGKTVFPVTTYAMSGLGTTEHDYAEACPGATLGEGLAVRGEEVRESGAAVESWLRRIGLLKADDRL